MGILESIAYALARGAVRAYFDVMSEEPTVRIERGDDEDRERARRAASIVDRTRAHADSMLTPEGSDDTGLEYRPQGIQRRDRIRDRG